MIEITPTDLNFKDTKRIAIVNEDFSNIDSLKEKISNLKSQISIRYFICPATFHLMDILRYNNVSISKTKNLKKSNFLSFAGLFLDFNGAIFLAVPITVNKSIVNEQGDIFNVSDLKLYVRNYGFHIAEVKFVTHGANKIKTSLKEKISYPESYLAKVEFFDENSYVVGFIKLTKIL